MLKRVNAALFKAPAGAEVRVVARAQANNGVQDARFEYANTVLDREPIQGMPGCRFTVEGARRQLQAIVAFAQGASGNARYDLFEVEPDGGLTDLEEFVKKSDSSPLIDFVIEGVAVPAVARPAAAGPVAAAGPARMPRAAAPPPASAPARRRKTAKRATKKGAAKRTRKAAATRKTSRPKAKTTGRTKARKTRAAKKKTARARTRRRTRS